MDCPFGYKCEWTKKTPIRKVSQKTKKFTIEFGCHLGTLGLNAARNIKQTLSAEQRNAGKVTGATLTLEDYYRIDLD